jgi:CheY-like chemotaxis protein
VLTYLVATAETPLLILCDSQMPVMNGFQLRDEIDLDDSLRAKAIPFIFLSTWANQGYHLKGERFADLQKRTGTDNRLQGAV